MSDPAGHLDDDRTQVIEQLAHIASALDRRDDDFLRDAFTPDAHGYGKDGAEAIVAQVRSHLGGVGATQHLLGNHRVTVDGDTARSLTYARVHHVGAGPMEGSFFECMGEYDDQWQRTPEGWKLARRRFDMQIMLGDFAVLRP
ncbi:nuclear transport factor 2 family protein [Nocardioides sp. JQ2195]|uniref:nuclear transport factor 2 family protein n=1 Tax=Nocardioides sp. JQ2195 TaxID=2592334 RepID=UPI00197DDCC5|nr:nuclear transport factor 2 family protein [Nocardioides sp. JQ2195]